MHRRTVNEAEYLQPIISNWNKTRKYYKSIAQNIHKSITKPTGNFTLWRLIVLRRFEWKNIYFLKLPTLKSNTNSSFINHFFREFLNDDFCKNRSILSTIRPRGVRDNIVFTFICGLKIKFKKVNSVEGFAFAWKIPFTWQLSTNLFKLQTFIWWPS